MGRTGGFFFFWSNGKGGTGVAIFFFFGLKLDDGVDVVFLFFFVSNGTGVFLTKWDGVVKTNI